MDEEVPGQWLEVWHLLMEHPWFREQLSYAARSVLRSSRCSDQWQKDIEHEAAVLLAGRLRKNPSLGVDTAQVDQRFAGWMWAILTHDCQDALRKLRRQSGSASPLPESLPASEDRVHRETRVDLAIALDQLDERERSVLNLYSEGFTLRQVASQLGLTFWTTHRLYHRGLERLHRLL